MLSIIPDRAKVVLIGMSDFPRDRENLPPLPAVTNNVNDLAAVITAADVIGIPRGGITTILDERKASDVQEKLARACREATDTLIIYYAGHGLISKTSSDLLFAVGDTTEADAEYNGVPFRVVKDAIADSGATKKVLIIDACFSGRALNVMAGGPSLLRATIDIKGAFVITSAPSNETAKAPEGERYTAFSGEFIRALDEGVLNDQRELTMRDIYEHIRNELRKRPGIPEPQHANLQDGARIIFARNRAFSHASLRLKAAEEKINQRIDQLDARIAEVSRASRSVQTDPHIKEHLDRLDAKVAEISKASRGVQADPRIKQQLDQLDTRIAEISRRYRDVPTYSSIRSRKKKRRIGYRGEGVLVRIYTFCLSATIALSSAIPVFAGAGLWASVRARAFGPWNRWNGALVACAVIPFCCQIVLIWLCLRAARHHGNAYRALMPNWYPYWTALRAAVVGIALATISLMIATVAVQHAV